LKKLSNEIKVTFSKSCPLLTFSNVTVGFVALHDVRKNSMEINIIRVILYGFRSQPLKLPPTAECSSSKGLRATILSTTTEV
jgi:hypothetical protein